MSFYLPGSRVFSLSRGGQKRVVGLFSQQEDAGAALAV